MKTSRILDEVQIDCVDCVHEVHGIWDTDNGTFIVDLVDVQAELVTFLHVCGEQLD